ncbi:hypothetical protein MASR1M6_37960 [Rubrivivax sp.]
MTLSRIATSDGPVLVESEASPNGRYRIAWRDHDGVSRGGHRESGHGKYWLFEDDVEIQRGELERPNCGHVADDGTFTLEDWLFTLELKSVFYAFDRMGNQLLAAKLAANTYRSAISPDGSVAVCQTAGSNSHKFSNKIIVYQLRPSLELWRHTSPFGTIRFEFAENNSKLTIYPGPGHHEPYFESCSFRVPPRRDA